MLAYSEPNQPLTLEKTSIIKIDGKSTSIPANVVLRLFPFPTVVIESDTLPSILLGKRRFQIGLDNGARFEAVLRSLNTGTGKGSLSPARQPVDVIDKGVPLRSVQFSVLNFPELYGNQSLLGSAELGHPTIPHAKLETADWCIEITGVSEIRTIAKSLRRESGFGLTYSGVATRSNGGDFSVDEAKSALEGLRLFLSFARGGYCSLALVEGKDQHREHSWVRWGVHRVSELSNGYSWLRTVGGDDILSGLFPKFFGLLESKSGWKETAVRTIEWYLESNESPPHVGLILTQAALERLSYEALGRKRCGKKDIEKALKNIPGMESFIPIPSGSKELVSLAKWQSAPHALADLRNDLVHPESSLAGVSTLVYHEAWNLGQWYIEMMLLNKLGYQGPYVNRLASRQRAGDAILTVPWIIESHDS